MKSLRNWLFKTNVHWVFLDESGNVLRDFENHILDGMADMLVEKKEVYSFRPANSGTFDFWIDSTQIINIQ